MKKIINVFLLCLFFVPFVANASTNPNIEYKYEDNYYLYVHGEVKNTTENQTYYYNMNEMYDSEAELENAIPTLIPDLAAFLEGKGLEYNEDNLQRRNSIYEGYVGYKKSSEDVVVTLNDEYDNPLEKIENGTITGGTVTVYITRYNSINLDYIAENNFATINNIEVSNVNTNLEVGKKPEFTGTTDNDLYSLVNEIWIDSGNIEPYYIEIVKDESFVENPAGKRTNCIVNNLKYSYAFYLKLQDGYTLSKNATININGTEYSGNQIYIGEEIINNEVYYSVYVHGISISVYDENYEIDTLEISNINDILYDGEKPEFTGTTNSDKYELYYEIWSEESNEETYDAMVSSDEEQNEAYKENGNFYYEFHLIDKVSKDKTYNYGASIETKNGYSFKENVNITLNGGEISSPTSDRVYSNITVLYLDSIFNVTPVVKPEYVIGENAEYDLNSEEDLLFEVEKDYAMFEGVLLDGEVVSSEMYDSYSGSTIVVLHKELLDTLQEGDHSLSILFSDGINADTTLNIVDNTPVEQEPTEAEPVDPQEPAPTEVDPEVVDQEPTVVEPEVVEEEEVEQEPTQTEDTENEVDNEKEVITNPSTNDNIIEYVYLLVISFVGLAFLSFYTYKNIYVKKD